MADNLTIPIIYYHRIAAPPANAPVKDIYMEPERFARQMKWLKRLGIQGINLYQFMDYFEKVEKPARHSVVITFDDGFEDNLDAFSLLNECGFSATIFVVAGSIGRRVNAQFATDSRGEMVLSAEQIRRLAREAADIQSHGMTHRRLTALPEKEAMRELADSKKILEDILGKAVDLFCYPYGDFNSRLEAMVKFAGYRAACSTARGKTHRPDERFCLKRIPVHYKQGTLKFFQYLYFKNYGRAQKKLDAKRGAENP